PEEASGLPRVAVGDARRAAVPLRVDAARDVGGARRGDGEAASGAARDLGVGPGEPVGIRERVRDERGHGDAIPGTTEVEAALLQGEQRRAGIVYHASDVDGRIRQTRQSLDFAE